MILILIPQVEILISGVEPTFDEKQSWDVARELSSYSAGRLSFELWTRVNSVSPPPTHTHAHPPPHWAWMRASPLCTYAAAAPRSDRALFIRDFRRA